jgi:CheY-like chemotaxis protein
MLNRKIIRRIIESDKDGFGDSDLFEVEDGTAAVDAVKQFSDVNPFDVIFMDYIMVIPSSY